MNPEKDPTPRDEQEMRLTALLMGELPPGEVVAVYAQMAADPELAALHRRLRKAMELLREASALPEQPAPPAPVQLSSERRERLLAHFKTAAPTPSATPEPIATLDPAAETPRRNWWWTVPMGLAAMLVVLLGGGLLMTNGLVQRKSAGWPDDAVAASQTAATYSRPRNVSGSQGGEFDVKTPSSEMNSAAGVGDPILFDSNSSRLSDKAIARLNNIARQLRDISKNARAKIIVTGSADPRGAHDANYVLSEQRVNAVMSALVQMGVAADRQLPSGDSLAPTAQSFTQADLAKMRAVAIYIQRM